LCLRGRHCTWDSADRGLALVGVFDVQGMSFVEPDFRR
jgi:hypothetical protein